MNSYIILWALLNIHTGVIDGPYPLKPYHEYGATECVQVLMDKGAQKPDKNGNVRIFECVTPNRRSTVQFTER